MKCLQQLCTLILLIGITQFTYAQNLTISSPASIAGDYPSVQAAFGVWSNGQSAQLMLIDDGAGVTDGCAAASNDLTGTIAVIDRGACGFAQKTANAEAAGAMAVVICNNNTDEPDDAIVMGGADGCTSTIPAIMLSYNSCVTIKAELANGVMGAMPGNLPNAGDAIGSSISLPGEGMYTSDTLAGDGAVFTDATAAKIYTIIPAMDVVMNVNSCLGGADTRLTILTGCRNELVVIGQNDDACAYDPDIVDEDWASSLDVVAYGGQEYIIHWDDRWSNDGFDFEVTYSALPTTDVVFTVDMSNETVDAGNPPMVAGSFNSWTGEALTDNTDGTWSGTFAMLAGDAIQYKFQNGTDNWESGVELEACGVDDGFGAFNRAYTVNLDSTQTLGADCFALCGSCPGTVPTDCAEPTVFLDDNFDAYEAGANNLGPQADHWSTWSGTEGGAEDATVSTAFANSGDNAMEILGNNGGNGGAQDVLLLLGNQAAGNFMLSWNMYVPAGQTAYFNMQHIEEGPGDEFAFEALLDADGAGSLNVGGVTPNPTFTYSYDAWFAVIQVIDLDNDWIDLYIDNQHVMGWPFSWLATAMTGGTNQIGAIDFFPRSDVDNYYVDDVSFVQLPAAADANYYCHMATPIVTGVTTAAAPSCFGAPDQDNAPAATWYSWTADADGFASVSSCNGGEDTRVFIYSECGARQTIGANDDECDLGSGSLWASYREWPTTAGTTYYIAWDNRWSDNGFDFEIATFTDGIDGNFCQTAIAADFGTYTIDTWGNAAVGQGITDATGANTNYSNSKWYSYTPAADGMVRAYSCDVAASDTRVWVHVGDCTYLETLTQVAAGNDDCGTQSDVTWAVTAGETYWIEWDDLGSANNAVHDWVFEAIVPTVAVTFNVNMGQVTDANPAFIAGEFNGWTGEAMTDNSDMTYSYTTELTVGSTVMYKFQNGSGGWEEGIPADCTMGNDGNRFVVVGDAAMEVDLVCFQECADCTVDVEETAFVNGLTLFPNPTSKSTKVTYNFNESLNLDITVSNTIGQELYRTSLEGVQSGSHAIDLTNFSPGLYLVQMTDGQNNLTKRLIVK